ncbi:ABC transporter permease subunit [Chelativorans sp. Marseille-P2723]|uniref:ABC transporter permease n=1 Tax=Chelativorans sp. Marseille-P2723 TaxID=2709133 RepID=UPI00156E24BC|nr:ABC transporter permease subunit [Chelativorans sp. Marseille-P2723]
MQALSQTMAGRVHGIGNKRVRRGNWFAAISAALCIFLAMLILVPIANILYDVFWAHAPGASPFDQLGSAKAALTVLANTSLVLGVAAILAVFFGSLFAWLNERTDVEMSWASKVLPIIPLLLPPIAGSIGWVMLASDRAGLLNVWGKRLLEFMGIQTDGPLVSIFSWSGLIFVYLIYTLPHVYLCVASALRNLDPSLEEASRVNGAGPLKTLVKVTLPAVLPAIISGGTISIIYGIALFSVPAIIASQAGIDILAVKIVNLMMAEFPPKTGAALLFGLVIVVVISVMTWIQRRVISSGKFATIGGKGAQVTLVKLGWVRWPARMLLLGYILVATILPFGTLFLVSLQRFWTANIDWSRLSFRHYLNVFGNSFASQGILNSLTLAISVATVVMFVTALIAFRMYTSRNWLVTGAIDFTLKLPATISNLVIGMAFIVMFAGAPFYLHGTLTILLLAYAVLYLPQASIIASSAIAQVGRQLQEASSVAGASEGKTFFRIMFPLMLPGLVAGWTMLFVLLAGDLTASAMLSGTGNPVIGSVILNLWTEGSFAPVAAFATVVSIIMASVVLTVMWISERLTQRSR